MVKPKSKRIVIINNYRNEGHLRHLEDALNQQLGEIKKENKDFNYKVVKYNAYEKGEDKREEIKKKITKGDVIISSGGTDKGEKIDEDHVKVGDPLHHHIRDKLQGNYFLGICHGAQAIGEAYGAKVKRTGKRHRKRRSIEKIESDQHLFESKAKNTYHANHSYYIKLEEGGELQPIVKSKSEHKDEKFIDAFKAGKYHYGTQFHPERTKRGKDFLKNFLYMAAGYSK